MTRAALRLVEVGPRDGLQNEKAVVPLEAKVAYVDALSFSGLREIEAGAFVSPKAVPQMADSAAVFAAIKRAPGVVYSALVPNEKGYEAALAAKAGKVSVFTAASETFNRKNINAGIRESIERFEPVARRAAAAGLPVRAYVSTAFWCPYEGAVNPGKVYEVVQQLEQLGVDEHSIGDTIGKSTPDEVRRLLDVLLKAVPAPKVFLHFHDTFGHAVENALTAWKEFGITGFDASTGGVGGCPYAPGAAGNVAMERLVEAFRAAGGETGVSLAKLREASAILSASLGRTLGG
jgi:hydroxymethylglutaryl-CoA lyase